MSLVPPKLRGWRCHMKTRSFGRVFCLLEIIMEHYFYIIYSPSKDVHYYGETNGLSARLKKHNEHSYVGSFTKMTSDWEYVVKYSCYSRDDALYLEDFIKRMRNRNFTKKIIQNPEILDDILSKRKCPWFPRNFGAGGTT